MKKNKDKDYYSVLGVSKDAKSEEISKAYKKLAKKYHPDINKEEGAVDKFKEVAEAYEVIGDSSKRASYDNGSSGNLFGGGFNPFGFDPSQFFGQKRGLDSRIDLQITLKQCFEGFNTEIKIPKKEKCKSCNGGVKSSEKCETCSGTGRINVRAENNWNVQMSCQKCGGRGSTNIVVCECGSGYKTIGEESIPVNIPAGIDSGAAIVLRGKGDYDASDHRGDAYIVVNVIPHAHIMRIGNDLTYRVWVPIEKMYFGGDINVVLFNSKFEVKIQPKTQSGSKLRLPGQGFRGGNLFLIVNADVNSYDEVKCPQENQAEAVTIDFSS